MNLLNFSLLVVGTVNFFLAFFIFFRKGKNVINQSFALFVLNSCLWAFSIAFFLMAPNVTVALFWNRLIYICGTLSAILFLSFSMTFVEKKNFINTWGLIFSLPPLIFIFLILFTDLFIQQITITPAGIDVDLGIAYTAWTVFFVLFFGWGVIELFVKYFDSRGIIRTQIKYILFAILATMVGAYSFNILLPLFGNYRYIHVGPFFTTVMVAIIAYAIAKHHFLDIRLVIARFFSYALLLVIFASLYSAAIFLASYIIFDFSIPPKTLVFLITLTVGISFSFQPIKKFLESATDEVFYKEGYDSEVFLKEIGNIMSATLSLDDLSQNFLEFIVKNFKISQANLILFEGKRHFKVYGFPKRAHFTEEQIRGLRRFDDGVIIFEELNKAPLGEILRQHQMTACSFLEAKGKKIGLLLLGEKLSGDVLSSQDIKVVEIMTPQAAVTVQNAQAFDEIQQFNITLNQKISHATAKLKRANVRLQELSKLKDEFVSIASHELRTPMTAIKSYLWLALNRGKLDAKTQKNLGRAFDSTERTINLVKDMLTVSRIEGRRLDVNKVPFDLVDLAKQIYNDLKIQAEEKQINFGLQLPKTVLTVTADRDRIGEVMINVIGNALKFTPNQGKVIVHLEKAGNQAQVDVIDNGPGIPKQGLSTLFKKFSRMEHSFSKLAEQPGTGLGLYIAKQILTLHQGKIWVKSRVGRGSTFSFSLPCPKRS